MNIANVQPNTPAWLELRKSYDTASEAPAASGASKYTSRTALMHQKFTGEVEIVGSAKQAIFDRGHEAEALARPYAEKIVGSDLYPITGTLEVDGLKLLASLDGATMDEEIIWEHKLWNASLAADVRNGTLDPHYTVQMDQQLRVSGAKKCLFMVSDGTEENMVWCWYVTSEDKQAALIAGWKQFNADLAVYVPPEVIVPAKAAPQMGLPAVSIQVSGSIALIDNLDVFGAALTAYIERINKKPETDQDFADLEATVRTLKAAEDALDAAEAGALAQTDSIDTMRKTAALYRETARANRLLVEKLVKAEKENRRNKLVSDASTALSDHIKGLNERLGKPYMPGIQADFPGVIKGLKSLDSMKDKLDTELARCKIAGNEAADRIQVNLTTLRELAGEHAFLFADTAQLVLKGNDDLTVLVKSRIAEHKAAEAKREEETRERIRAEEQAKAEKAAREKLAAEQAAAAEAERIAATPPATATLVAPAVPNVTHEAVVNLMPATVRKAIAAPAPAATSEPTLKLGTICARLGIGLTKDFISENLRIEPAARDRSAVLYREEDFSLICDALQKHIYNVACDFVQVPECA